MTCPHLKECGLLICIAASSARLASDLEFREYCTTAHCAECPYFDGDAQDGAFVPRGTERGREHYAEDGAGHDAGPGNKETART